MALQNRLGRGHFFAISFLKKLPNCLKRDVHIKIDAAEQILKAIFSFKLSHALHQSN